MINGTFLDHEQIGKYHHTYYEAEEWPSLQEMLDLKRAAREWGFPYVTVEPVWSPALPGDKDYYILLAFSRATVGIITG